MGTMSNYWYQKVIENQRRDSHLINNLALFNHRG